MELWFREAGAGAPAPRAFDVGCAVGGSAFALSAQCASVLGQCAPPSCASLSRCETWCRCASHYATALLRNLQASTFPTASWRRPSSSGAGPVCRIGSRLKATSPRRRQLRLPPRRSARVSASCKAMRATFRPPRIWAALSTSSTQQICCVACLIPCGLLSSAEVVLPLWSDRGHPQRQCVNSALSWFRIDCAGAFCHGSQP